MSGAHMEFFLRLQIAGISAVQALRVKVSTSQVQVTGSPRQAAPRDSSRPWQVGPHMAHKPHGRQVQVVRRARLQHLGGEDGARAEVRVADQLRGAPHERQKLVVVQAPHAVRARRLQPAITGRASQLALIAKIRRFST